MINLLDIALHTGFAALWAGMVGVGAALGLSHGRAAGRLLFALSGGAWAAGLLYWPLRERQQHGYEWGGVQSTLEWAVPLATQLVVFAGVMGFKLWRRKRK